MRASYAALRLAIVLALSKPCLPSHETLQCALGGARQTQGEFLRSRLKIVGGQSMQSGIVVLFALTSFMGAFLLFTVQPMIGKMALPIFGGTPAVWNTSLVFFQGTLLAGYLWQYAGGSMAWNLRAQRVQYICRCWRPCWPPRISCCRLCLNPARSHIIAN